MSVTAFSMGEENETRSLFVWSRADGELRRITEDTFSEYEPVWDPDGDYLYFLSDRTYAPQISNVEWNFAGNRTTGIFCLALREDVEHPFPAKSDEVTLGKDADEKGAENAEGIPRLSASGAAFLSDSRYRRDLRDGSPERESRWDEARCVR